jgi:hypothetical protein
MTWQQYLWAKKNSIVASNYVVSESSGLKLIPLKEKDHLQGGVR